MIRIFSSSPGWPQFPNSAEHVTHKGPVQTMHSSASFTGISRLQRPHSALGIRLAGYAFGMPWERRCREEASATRRGSRLWGKGMTSRRRECPSSPVSPGHLDLNDLASLVEYQQQSHFVGNLASILGPPAVLLQDRHRLPVTPRRAAVRGVGPGPPWAAEPRPLLQLPVDREDEQQIADGHEGRVAARVQHLFLDAL